MYADNDLMIYAALRALNGHGPKGGFQSNVRINSESTTNINLR
jgi:hypothetical protein